MNSRNRKLIVAGLVALIIAAVATTIYQHRSSPSYTKKIVSPDTGEALYIQPNKKPEANAGSGIVLFGAYLLINNGATQNQLKAIKSTLTAYSKKNLGNKYEYLTLIPASFSAKAGNMNSKIRLGKTSNFVNIQIKIWQLKYVSVVIKDPSGKNGGNYNSGTIDSLSHMP